MVSITTSLVQASTIVLATSQLAPSVLPFSTGSSILLLAIVLYVPVAAYRVLVYPYFSPLRHLPGPKSKSFLHGEMGRIMISPGGEPHKEWSRIPNDGLIRYLGLWNGERLMPTNAKMLQQVLTTDAHIWVKPSIIRKGPLSTVLGTRGLLFTEGEEHRAQRRILNPAFSRRQIRNLVPVFWEKSVQLADAIAAAARNGNGVVDFARWSSLGTLDIIGAAGLGYDFRAIETGGAGSELARAYKKLSDAESNMSIVWRGMELMLPTWFTFYLPGQRSRDIREIYKTVRVVSRQLIATKRAELSERKSQGEERDILSVMLNSGEYNTPDGEEVMRDQLLTFLAAGHETTATLTTWAIHALTLHPEYQQILRDEIRAAYPAGCPDVITYEQLDSFKFLQNFAQEVIRYYPPVPLTMRENNQDTTLGDAFIPKGTLIAVVPWALHKDPKLWGPGADVFRPERWENEQMESNYNLMTFIAGPHSCIGKDFARMEFKALLAVLVGRLAFEGTGQKIEIQSGITSRPKPGLNVKVREVAGW